MHQAIARSDNVPSLDMQGMGLWTHLTVIYLYSPCVFFYFNQFLDSPWVNPIWHILCCLACSGTKEMKMPVYDEKYAVWKTICTGDGVSANGYNRISNHVAI